MGREVRGLGVAWGCPEAAQLAQVAEVGPGQSQPLASLHRAPRFPLVLHKRNAFSHRLDQELCDQGVVTTHLWVCV